MMRTIQDYELQAFFRQHSRLYHKTQRMGQSFCNHFNITDTAILDRLWELDGSNAVGEIYTVIEEHKSKGEANE